MYIWIANSDYRNQEEKLTSDNISSFFTSMVVCFCSQEKPCCGLWLIVISVLLYCLWTLGFHISLEYLKVAYQRHVVWSLLLCLLSTLINWNWNEGYEVYVGAQKRRRLFILGLGWKDDVGPINKCLVFFFGTRPISDSPGKNDVGPIKKRCFRPN